MLSGRDLVHSYGERRVLRGTDIDIARGEILGLRGDSGSGKTTLGRILAGWQAPDRGEVLIDGTPPPTRGFHPVQLIAQHPERAVDPRLPLSHVVSNPALLEAFDIDPQWLQRRAGEVSGGQLQRLNIARALDPRTEFLIADEITTAVDALVQMDIWRALVAQVRERNLGVLVISHDHHLLGHVADRVADLADLQ